MKSKYKSQITSICTVFVLLLTMTIGALPASAVNYFESEGNNTLATADITYDDYNNYGAITSTSDVDWWKVTFSSEGMVNFWLGSIPDDCDFELSLYNSSGYILATSTNAGIYAETIRTHVQPNVTYYLKIFSADGYSATDYLFRVKRYDLKPVRVFTNNLSGNPFGDVANYVLPPLQRMGYDAGHYLNNPAISVYETMPGSEIVLLRGHGAASCMPFPYEENTESLLYANNSGLATYDCSISNYYDGELSNVSLVIYAGCNTGMYGIYGNLVQTTHAKGAKCVIGWTALTNTRVANLWHRQFILYCEDGLCVEEAMQCADEWVYEYEEENAAFQTSRYVAGSASAVLLG